MERFVVVFLSQPELSYLEQSVSTVEFLVGILGHLLKMKNCIGLFG